MDEIIQGGVGNGCGILYSVDMRNFSFYNPVKIVFGIGEIAKLGIETRSIGKKPIVIFGKSSARESGLDERCLNILKDSGLEPTPFYGIEPNPRETTCDKAVMVAKEHDCDCIVGVGGGSVMDASKLIAVSASGGKSVWSYVKREEKVKSALPILLVPTLAATGSEFNAGAVITNWESNEKLGFHSSFVFPKTSIMDPELSTTTPPVHTAYGGIDIIIHVLETYLTTDDEHAPIQDYVSEGVMKTVMEYLPQALDEGNDLTARSQLSWASAVALCGIPNNGRSGGFLMHWMEHVMSAHYDIPHGLGLAYLLLPTLEYVERHFPNRYEKFISNVTGDIKGFLESVDCLTSLEEMGIPERMATRFIGDLFEQKAVGGQLPGNPELTKEGAKRIYLGKY